jgi:hypothetical protein
MRSPTFRFRGFSVTLHDPQQLNFYFSQLFQFASFRALLGTAATVPQGIIEDQHHYSV